LEKLLGCPSVEVRKKREGGRFSETKNKSPVRLRRTTPLEKGDIIRVSRCIGINFPPWSLKKKKPCFARPFEVVRPGLPDASG